MPGSVTIAKGNVRLEIDETGLEASFLFTPDSGGAEWTAEKLQRTLTEARVGQGYSIRLLDDLVQRFSRTKAPVRVSVVKGVPPEDPLPERVTWIDMTPSPEIASFADDAYFMAKAPEIYETRSEKTKKETKVKKASPLPFLPAKEETVVTWETKEIRERAIINPETAEKGFVKSGTRIGLISPSRQGKNGKSIFGSPVTPASPNNLTFLTGTGIRREKNEIWADETGFVRIGANWIDIVPFKIHEWTIIPSEDKSAAFLTYSPGDPRLEPPKAADLLKAAIDAGVPAANIFDEGHLSELITKMIEEKKNLDRFPLMPTGDAVIQAEISPDRLRATLFVRKGTGSAKPLQLREIGAEIGKLKLKSIKQDQVKVDLLAFFNGPALEMRDYVLAQGSPAGRGKDREAVPAITFLPDEAANEIRQRYTGKSELLLRYHSITRFPISEVQKFAFVEKDQILLQIAPGTPGSPGSDVFGNTIEGLPGNDPDLQPFENVRLSSNAVEAQIRGILHFAQDSNTFKLRVHPYRDAVISVRVKSDRMEAFISLERELGAGKPLTADRVNEALKSKNVVKGLDGPELGRAFKEALEGKAVNDRRIAQGKPPTAAGGTNIEFAILLSGNPESVEGAKATVKENQVFARAKTGPRDPQEGWDVTGAAVKSSGTSDQGLKHDESVREVSGADGVVDFVAIKSGELRYLGRSLSIVSKKVVDSDLSHAMGAIRFSGDIQINGTVATGAQVFAGASVIIAGTMEAALVSAEGSVTVQGGIRGNGKGIIRAKSSIRTLFAEGAVLLSVDNVNMERQCFNCRVKTNGALVLSGDHGTLAGGSCKAKKGMDVMNLGTSSKIKTEISFGQDYLIADQIDLEERELADLKEKIVKVDLEMKRGAKGDLSLAELGQQKVSFMKLLEKRSHHTLTLREKFEEHFPSEVRVRGTAFPGAILESHGRYFEVTQAKSRVVFFFNSEIGRVQEKPLSQGG